MTNIHWHTNKNNIITRNHEFVTNIMNVFRISKQARAKKTNLKPNSLSETNKLAMFTFLVVLQHWTGQMPANTVVV